MNNPVRKASPSSLQIFLDSLPGLACMLLAAFVLVSLILWACLYTQEDPVQEHSTPVQMSD